MYKLVIADDEPKIRRGLKNILDWNAYDIEFVGEAEDGESAYEIFRQLKPDILFLDICMPFLNGLDLLSRIKRENDSCRIIIITGYDEFSYAQQAIRCGASDYLLKPVSISELEKTVRRTVAELNSAQKFNCYKKLMDRKPEDIAELMRDQYFYSLICDNQGMDPADELMIPGINRTEKLELFVIRISRGPAIDNLDKNALCYGIRNILKELFNQNGPSCFFDDKNLNLVMVYADVSDENQNRAESVTDYIEAFTQTSVIWEKYSALRYEQMPKAYEEICGRLTEKAKLHPITQMIVKYIENHAGEKSLSLSIAARDLNISPSYLSKLLKDDIGMTFVDYLTDIRIKRAKQLLEKPNIRIYEASDLVGYSNQYYFSRAFKKITGISPIEFKEGRKNCKKNA